MYTLRKSAVNKSKQSDWYKCDDTDCLTRQLAAMLIQRSYNNIQTIIVTYILFKMLTTTKSA